MDYHGREQKNLHFGDLIADASSLPDRKDHHAVGQVFIQSSGLVQESRRVEDVRILPLLRVVVDGPLVDEHHGVFGDVETFDGDVCGGGVWDGDGDEAGVAHGFVDEGVQVSQVALVFY